MSYTGVQEILPLLSKKPYKESFDAHFGPTQARAKLEQLQVVKDGVPVPLRS